MSCEIIDCMYCWQFNWAWAMLPILYLLFSSKYWTIWGLEKCIFSNKKIRFHNYPAKGFRWHRPAGANGNIKIYIYILNTAWYRIILARTCSFYGWLLGEKTGTVNSMEVLKALVFTHTSKESLLFAMHLLPEIVTAIIYYSFIPKLSLQPNPLTLS